MAFINGNQVLFSAKMTMGYEEGRKAEYDIFWDAFQKSGESTDYTYAFSGTNWDDVCYNPKYPIKATTCTNMFRNSVISDVKVTIDVSSGTGTHVLNNCKNLVKVPKIIVNENLLYTGWFSICPALEEISFEGVIGSSISFANSPLLTIGSIESILRCLSKTTTVEQITFNSAVKETFYNAYKTAFDNADLAWDYLCGQYTNWTFVLR